MRDSLTLVCLHCVLLSGVVGLACKKQAAPSAPPATVASAAPSKGTAPAPAAASSPAQPVFEQWLASQNNGDFAVYQNLYADSFTAVARAGSRTRTIKRAAWLAEHKRKFRKPMTVVISDRRLTPAGDTLQARFTETVDSGTYHEEAEKVLTFAEVNGTWQIAKEELLAKKVDASKSAAMSSMAFVFVWEDQPVIVSDAADDCTVGQPKIEDDSTTAVMRVDEKRLPSSVREWKGERLVMIDDKLEECEVNVTGFSMITVSEWDMGTIEGQIEGRKTKAAIAAKVWEGTHQLVARTDTVSSGCERPVIARPARLPKLKLYAFEDADEPLTGKAVAKLMALPEVAKMAEDTQKESPDWEASPKVTVANLGKGGSLVTARVVGEDCGGPGYYAVAIWHTDRQNGKGDWQLVRSPSEGDQLSPVMAFDLDGDGTMEILFRDEYPNLLGLLRWNGNEYGVGETLKIPYSDCRC